MCLGVPARILDVADDRGTPMATVDFGGATRSVCLAYTPEAQPGEYVVVHAGFAISIVDETEADAALQMFEQLGILDAAPSAQPDGSP